MTPLFHVLRCCLWLIVLSDGTREIPLKSDSSLRFVNFKEYKFHYLEVPKSIKTQRVRQIFECGMECLENSDCISLNVAAFQDQEGRFWCELLLANMINNSECLRQNASSHHFAKWVS